jgi:hypothetical protein
MIRSRVFTLSMALLAIVACDKEPSKNVLSEAEDSYARHNPIGRYQMQAGVNAASVAVLDTRTGTLQNCFIVDSRYHCLAQDRTAATADGLPEPTNASH